VNKEREREKKNKRRGVKKELSSGKERIERKKKK